MIKKHLEGSFLIIIAMIMYSFNGVLVNKIGLDPKFITFLLGLLASIAMIAYFTVTKQFKLLVEKHNRLLLVVNGLLGFTTVLTFFMAYTLTSFSNAVITHYIAPIIAALFAPIFLKEKLEKISLVSLVIAMLGLYFITAKDLSFTSANFMGILLGSISGLTYGFQIINNKHLLKKVKRSVIFSYQSFALVLLTPLFLHSYPFVALTANKIYLIFLFVLISMMIPTFVMLKGLRFVKAQHAGIIAYIEVVAAILWGFLFFKQIPSVNTIIGGILIIGSGILVIKYREKEV